MWTGKVSGNLYTPILTPETARAHHAEGRDPIAIYPEVSLHNRLACNRVIRYLLNLPGARNLQAPEKERGVEFWNSQDRRRDRIWHFAEEFRPKDLQSRFLSVPIVDESISYNPPSEVKRQGFLVYSHRTKVTPDMIPEWAHPYTMIDIATPRGPDELAGLYRTSRALLAFERTGATGEALMCGCAVR
jgi:hypothetical protein